MDGRLRILLLRTLGAAALMAAAGCSMLRPGQAEPPATDAGPSAPVIQPEVARRAVQQPKIDGEDFEVGAFVGSMSVEDFGTSFLYGARATYHISEGLFVQGTYGETGDVDETSFETLTNVDLLGGDRKYKYWDVAFGYNLLPGEVFFGRNHAYNSALYLVAGAGNTSFGGEDRFTVTFGAGFQVLITDSIAIHLDARDHMFDSDVTGDDKTTNNVELSLGGTWYF